MFSVDFNVSAQFEKIILQPRNYNRSNIYKFEIRNKATMFR